MTTASWQILDCGSRPPSEDGPATSDGGLSEPEPAREPVQEPETGTEDFALRWKLAKGDSLRYRVVEDQTILTKAGLDIENVFDGASGAIYPQ